MKDGQDSGGAAGGPNISLLGPPGSTQQTGVKLGTELWQEEKLARRKDGTSEGSKNRGSNTFFCDLNRAS